MGKTEMYKIPPLNVLEMGMVLNALQAHRNNLMREEKPVDDVDSAYKKVYAVYPQKRVVRDDCHVI